MVSKISNKRILLPNSFFPYCECVFLSVASPSPTACPQPQLGVMRQRSPIRKALLCCFCEPPDPLSKRADDFCLASHCTCSADNEAKGLAREGAETCSAQPTNWFLQGAIPSNAQKLLLALYLGMSLGRAHCTLLGCQELNLSLLQARPTPYKLYYHSSPNFKLSI